MSWEKPITFDTFVRWLVGALVVIGVCYILNYLSSVLLPFFIAWLLAYMLYPMVKFVQYKLRVRSRVLSIIITLVVVVSVVVGIIWLIVPPMIGQFEKLGDLATHYVQSKTQIEDFPTAVQEWIQTHNRDIERFFKSSDFTEVLRQAAPQLFNVLGQTASIIISVIGSFITILYMFFILLDYEYLTGNWIRIFPMKSRPFWQGVATDVERAMNSYIRGQGLVALIMGVLFCIGFTVIDFPMAIGLGILIGIMDLVPYLHSLALIPTVFLALLKAADTGQNFWAILASALAVFIIVQVIIDFVVTPKVMGKAMGLNPAILLLSLSVWGALLGFIGLIIALPLTTLIMAYYQRYITKEKTSDEQT